MKPHDIINTHSYIKVKFLYNAQYQAIMFKFLKSLLEKEPIVSEVSIKKEELGSWLDDLEDEAINKVIAQVNDIGTNISKSLESAESHIQVLGQAELRNKKIPKRALQIMIGNRDAYIKKTRSFLAKVETEFDSDVLESISVFTKDLADLGKSNTKSYFVLKEFLADETTKIGQDIKDIENYMAQIKAVMTKSGLASIREVKSILDTYNKRIALRNKLNREIADLSADFESESQQQVSIDERMKKIEASSEYKSFENYTKKRDQINSQLKGLDNELTHIFSSIESGLKKYARVALDEKSIISYLNDPLKTLINDKELMILSILDGLEKGLASRRIDMKDKKREKILESLRKIDPTIFTDIRKRYQNFKDNKKELDNKITKNRVMQDYDEQEYLLKHSKQKSMGLKKQRHLKIKALDKIEVNNIEDNIKKIALKKLNIVLTF